MMIETNTQELREILQAVYELPQATNSGSGKPDLVITAIDPDCSGLNGATHKFTFDSAEVLNVYTKLIAGETVNCVLNANYWPDSGGMVMACSPHNVAFAKAITNGSGVVGEMQLAFRLYHIYNGNEAYSNVIMGFSILSNNTANLMFVGAYIVFGYSSAYV